MNKEINAYITKRYERWLDRARFECLKAGMSGREHEVISEVVFSILKRDESFILQLLNQKKVQKGEELTELDWFVLKAIETNVNSETSPYRYKNRLIPRANIELSRLNILDIEENETDHAGYILDRMREIRTLIESMGFSEKAMAIFEYLFFEDGNVKDWPGPEKPKEIYCLYARIMKILRKKINGELLI